jgi:cold shock CspA family protein
MKFGFIVSIKETFGFIQDFVNDDQIFFSLREIKNLDTLNIGDIIQYKELNGPKGLSAENISIPPLEQLECLGTYEGIVTRECDAHRFIPGCVKLSNDNIKKENTENVIQKQDSGELAYEDFSITEMKSSLSDSSPRSKLPDLISFIYVNNQNSITFSGKPKIIKGDYIEFQLYGIQSIGLYQGRHMRVMKTKKELQRQDQIDRMLNAGATREEGLYDD